MSFHATELKRRCLIAFFLCVAVFPTFAQSATEGSDAPAAPAASSGPVAATEFPITFASPGGITTTLVAAPTLGPSSSSGGGGGGDNKWLKVEFHYSVTPSKGAEFVDSAEFKVWIEARDLYAPNAPGDEGIAVMLTGTVTYINIPKGKDAYGVFYVSPSTLARYSSKQGVSDFERKFNVHVEVSIGGKMVDVLDKNKDTDKWWLAPPSVSGLVYRQDQSPFLLTDGGRYPMIKLRDAQ